MGVEGVGWHKRPSFRKTVHKEVGTWGWVGLDDCRRRENPPSRVGGVCSGWDSHPSLEMRVGTGRVAVAVKTLRLTFRAREGFVVGEIHLRHSKRKCERCRCCENRRFAGHYWIGQY